MNQCLFSVLNHPDWNIQTSMYIIHDIIPLFSAVLYFDYILAEKYSMTTKIRLFCTTITKQTFFSRKYIIRFRIPFFLSFSSIVPCPLMVKLRRR